MRQFVAGSSRPAEGAWPAVAAGACVGRRGRAECEMDSAGISSRVGDRDIHRD
jgi:hypothetical protein